MAYEIKPWKQAGCAIPFATAAYSQRAPHSEEINTAYGEGGALNATYTTVEAVAVVSNALRGIGLVYGKDFVFKTGGTDTIDFDFVDEKTMLKAQNALKHSMRKAA